VTLVCAYFAACEATKRYGIPIVLTQWPDGYIEERSQGNGYVEEFLITKVESPFPFILAQREIQQTPIIFGNESPIQQYYLWLFGPKVKHPVESVW
jgi:hypothetical protein